MGPNPQFLADLVTFTEEILMENFIFCAVLRPTTGQGGLNHLMILSAYKENLDELNLKDVVRELIHKNDTKKSLFGKK